MIKVPIWIKQVACTMQPNPFRQERHVFPFSTHQLCTWEMEKYEKWASYKFFWISCHILTTGTSHVPFFRSGACIWTVHLTAWVSLDTCSPIGRAVECWHAICACALQGMLCKHRIISGSKALYEIRWAAWSMEYKQFLPLSSSRGSMSSIGTSLACLQFSLMVVYITRHETE